MTHPLAPFIKNSITFVAAIDHSKVAVRTTSIQNSFSKGTKQQTHHMALIDAQMSLMKSAGKIVEQGTFDKLLNTIPTLLTENPNLAALPAQLYDDYHCLQSVYIVAKENNPQITMAELLCRQMRILSQQSWAHQRRLYHQMLSTLANTDSGQSFLQQEMPDVQQKLIQKYTAISPRRRQIALAG